MWQGFLVIGVIACLVLIILYCALVAASNADDLSEVYFDKLERSGNGKRTVDNE